MKGKGKILAIGLCAMMAFPLAACGDKTPEDAGDRTVVQYFVTYDVYSQAPLQELVKTYNEGQGVTDGVYVQPKWVSGTKALTMQDLSGNCRYNVVTIADDEFKTFSTKDYFVSLDNYMTEDIKAKLDWDGIPKSLTNRFRMNSEKNADGKYEAGEGTSIKGLPIFNDPQVLYYNANHMTELKINVISVAEDKLADYNSANHGILQPHGYAEYVQKPYDGAIISQNALGEDVYKVFNNRIPMDWAEYRCLLRYLQENTSADYGLFSEWWFYYGFPIGADCIGWNETEKTYELVMHDKNPNWLVQKAAKIGNTAYAVGDTVYYEDKSSVTQAMQNDGTVYPLPSNYDMYVEFIRMIKATDKEVDSGVNGYGIADISPDITGGFLNGKTSMMVNFYHEGNSMNNSSMSGKWDYAPTATYREYGKGYADRTYTVDGKEYLKVIGAKNGSDSELYTGELKIACNPGGASEATALCIPKNSDPKKYEAAFKFIAYAASPEGQQIISKSNKGLPNQLSIGLSDEFSAADARPSKNAYGAALTCKGADLGDYSYFQTQTWVGDWSSIFNTDVRRGDMLYKTFTEHEKYASSNEKLKQLTMRIYGR